jgi:transketolase
MLLYAMLHLSGYDLSIEDLKQFRQLHSRTPGHPEHGLTPGVETTTGPLGQGLANAVGMALAEKLLANEFNQAHFSLIDHFTYCLVGDGCLMEGISHEVASFAGTYGLGKLIVLWDDNGISIDGQITQWCREDVCARFRAYGWQTLTVDGHDAQAIFTALQTATTDTQQPTLIQCKTQIGYGSPTLAGTAACHGAPLGSAEILLTKQALQWPYAPFEIPTDIYQAWDARPRGQAQESAWQAHYAQYQMHFPELAEKFAQRLKNLPDISWPKILIQTQTGTQNISTRKASQWVLEQLLPHCPALLGGSADLSESNSTQCSHSQSISPENMRGNYIHYGVREFGMSAIMNGLALYGGFIPYGGTFLTFSDYARNALRMAALMKQRVIFIYTHDSIGFGEDGPTHQPIEHLNALRMIPNLHVWRPADLTETLIAWQAAIEHRTGPSCLILTRQNVPRLTRSPKQIAEIEKGAYILRESRQAPHMLLIATGSELALTLAVAQMLDPQAQRIRVIAMPCAEIFLQQSQAYQEAVLPLAVRKRIAIEAGSTHYWYRWVGLDGLVMGWDDFGLSAPAAQIYDFCGLTLEKMVEKIRKYDENSHCN